MKPKLTTLIVFLLLWSLGFFGSLIGTAYLVVVPKIQMPALPPPPPKVIPKVPIGERDILKTAKTMTELVEVAEEMDLWQKEVQKRVNDVAHREEELNRREILLNAEKSTLDKREKEVLDIQKQINSKFISMDEKDKAHYVELGQLFTKMNVKDAVNFFVVYPDEELVKLLPNIPPKARVQIFEEWGNVSDEQRKRAIRIADKLRFLEDPTAQPQTPTTPQTPPSDSSSPPVSPTGATTTP